MSTGIIRSGQNADKSEFYSTNVIYSGDNDNDIQYLVNPVYQGTDVTPTEIADTDVYIQNDHICTKSDPPYLYGIESWTRAVSTAATGMCSVTVEKKEDGKSVVYNFDVASWRKDELPYDTLKGDYSDWYRWLPLKLNGVMVGAISEVESAGYRNAFKVGGDFWVQDDAGAYAVSYVVHIENRQEIVSAYRFLTRPDESFHDDELSRHIGCYYLYRNCLYDEINSSTNPELYLDPDCTVLATYGDVCNMMPENIRIVYLDRESGTREWAIHFISSVSWSGEVWFRSTSFSSENFAGGVKQTNVTIVPSYRITPHEYRYNTRKHGSIYNEACVCKEPHTVWAEVGDRILDMYTIWTDMGDQYYVRSTADPHSAYDYFKYHMDAEISFDVDNSYLFLAQKYNIRDHMDDGSLLTIDIDDFITVYGNNAVGGTKRAPLYSDPDCTDLVGDYGRVELGYGAYITTIELYDTEIDSSLDGRSTRIDITRDRNKTVDDVVEETVRDLITHSAYNDRYVTATKYMTMLADPESKPLLPPSFIVDDLDNNFDYGYVMSVTPEEIIYASMLSPGDAKSLTF